MPLSITDVIHGPFVLLIVDHEDCAEEPHVICPTGGFETKDEAIKLAKAWLDTQDGKDMVFNILPLRDPSSFMRYMSF